MRELRLKILPGGLMVRKNKYYSKMRNSLKYIGGEKLGERIVQ